MPTSAEAAVYLDSSALVKLIVAEEESGALIHHLAERPVRASCSLARVEVVRAVAPHGREATQRARRLLERIHLLVLDDALLDAAGALGGKTLRSLDAIHLAAARTLGASLGGIVTYDQRMASAAQALGLEVAAPG